MALRIRGLLLVALLLVGLFFLIFQNPSSPLPRQAATFDKSPPPNLNDADQSEASPVSSGPIKGVIYVMFGHYKQLDTFRVLLDELRQNLITQYPIILFHDDPDLSLLLKSEAKKQPELDISIVKLEFSVPDHVPPEKVVEKPAGFEGKIGSVGYRHMCRFYSGEVFMHPALQDFDYAWRLDPDSSLPCSLPVDPFQEMRAKGYKYGYSLFFFDSNPISGDTLWKSVLDYVGVKGITPKSGFSALAQKFPATDPGNFHRCHYWNNSEMMDLRFFRSKIWQDFFDYLDRLAGFYEFRWGDALVRTMGVDLFLEEHEVYRFNEIAYSHGYHRNTSPGCDKYEEANICPDGICYHCTWLEKTFRGLDKHNLPKIIAMWLSMLCGVLTVIYLLVRTCLKLLGGQSSKVGQE